MVEGVTHASAGEGKIEYMLQVAWVARGQEWKFDWEKGGEIVYTNKMQGETDRTWGYLRNDIETLCSETSYNK